MKKTAIIVLMILLALQVFPTSGMKKAHASVVCGTLSAGQYIIKTAEELACISTDSTTLSQSYKLGADIDLANYDYDGPSGPDIGGWMPIIGASNITFSGTLDGNGYVIRNMTINRPTKVNVGLFDKIDNAQLLNIQLLDINVTGSGTIGGLTSNSFHGTIQNCYVTGKVTALNSLAGGLVAVNSGSIMKSYAEVEVRGWDRLGGLVSINNGEIKDSYATGDVIGNNEIGGLVGYMLNSSTIQNSYAVGHITGNMSSLGGLVGRLDAGLITNSYWNKNTSGQLNSAGGTEVISEDNLMIKGTFNSWDFVADPNANWGIREGVTYPYLLAFAPKITIDPLAVTAFDLSPGHNGLSVKGTVLDGSIGEQVKIKYDISGPTVSSVTYNVYASGRDQSVDQTIPLAGLPDGTYTLNVTATDTYNTSVVAAPLTFTINSTAPSVNVTMTTSAGAYSNNTWTNKDVTLRETASDGNGVTSNVYTINGGSPNSYTSDLLLQADGVYVLSFKATDSQGLEKTENRTVNIDKTPPKITLIGSSTANLTTGGTYTEQGVTATDSGGSGIAGAVVITGTVNMSVIGTYTLRYNVNDAAGNAAAEVMRTVTVQLPTPIPPIPPKPAIDLNGVTFDPAKIDTAKPSVTLEVTPKEGVAYVSIPANILTSLEGKNATFFIEIKTPYGSYQVPVNLASLIPGLNNLLDKNYLNAEDISFKITLTDKSGDTDIQAAFTNGLPNGKVMGAIVNFSIEIITKSGKNIGTADNFSKALTRVIPIPRNITNMPEQWGAFRYNETTKKFEFVAAKKVQIDGVWYVMINSYSNSNYVVAENPMSFTDVNKHWSQPFVQLAAAKGLVDGVGNSQYDPDKAVTRAEFTALLVRALGRGTSTGSTTPYDDVKQDAWYFGVVAKAKELGLLNFVNGTSYKPDQPLTREEMASMLAAVITLEKLPITKGNASLNGYKDVGSVNAAYLEDVRMMVKLQIMTGTGADTFSPKGETTRAQAAVVFIRTLQRLEMID